MGNAEIPRLMLSQAGSHVFEDPSVCRFDLQLGRFTHANGVVIAELLLLYRYYGQLV